MLQTPTAFSALFSDHSHGFFGETLWQAPPRFRSGARLAPTPPRETGVTHTLYLLSVNHTKYCRPIMIHPPSAYSVFFCRQDMNSNWLTTQTLPADWPAIVWYRTQFSRPDNALKSAVSTLLSSAKLLGLLFDGQSTCGSTATRDGNLTHG